jgi:hypothetical protein
VLELRHLERRKLAAVDPASSWVPRLGVREEALGERYPGAHEDLLEVQRWLERVPCRTGEKLSPIERKIRKSRP